MLVLLLLLLILIRGLVMVDEGLVYLHEIVGDEI